MRSRRVRHAAAIGAVALSLVAAGCSKKGGGDDIPEAGPATTQAPTTLATVASPLTGEAVSQAVADRPAVIIKVDNSPQARPQAGLDDADVIYEERVEGSVVRFLAVYQSQDAKVVGPVRSVRSTDAAIVAPLGGVFAFSGGIEPFIAKVRGAGVKTIVESDDPDVGIAKRAGKTRPYATYANTEKLRAQDTKNVAPPALFARLPKGADFAEANPSSTPVTGVRVVFGSLTTADWTWDAARETFLRSTNNTKHLLENGERLNAPCLILETVPYKSTPYTDRSGAAVDEAVITGSGKAIVACEGHAVEATWKKSSQKSVTTYTNAVTGTPIKLPVGRVWVSLVPTNGTITLKKPLSGTSSTTSKL